MRTVLVIVSIILSGMLASADAQKPSHRRDIVQSERFERERQSRRDIERTLPYLAYTLGELHYLAYACEGNDAQEWRDRMVELLAMEASSRGRDRDRLIEAFNDGYRVQQRYRPVCGPEVDAERRALAHRGRDLAEMMRSAYFD